MAVKKLLVRGLGCMNGLHFPTPPLLFFERYNGQKNVINVFGSFNVVGKISHQPPLHIFLLPFVERNEMEV